MKVVEFGLWVTGTLMLALFVGAYAWAESQRDRGVEAFAAHYAESALPPQELPGESTGTPAPATRDLAVAVLRIGVIQLEVPVYDGTSEQILRRGAGLVEGTAVPGTHGNVGIAAHRDSFFRGLKDVSVGDLIELDVPGESRLYRITGLSVVEPVDVHVLDDTGQDLLTLVTCYPFYFVGSAPQRFIVRAEAVEAHL